MEERNQESKQRNRFEERDKEVPSPTVRAGYVYNLVKENNPELNNWDLLCFAVEYFGSQTLVYPWFGQDEVRKLIELVYTDHYNSEDPLESGLPKGYGEEGVVKNEKDS